jgi:hypothetical protein
MYFICILLLLCTSTVHAEHMARYASECSQLSMRRSVVLFTDRNTNTKLCVVMNSIADSLRAMNYEPIISYETCGAEINLKPSFIQFDDTGNIIRVLDPSNPPPQVRTEIDIFGYFAESSLTSRINKVTRVDFTHKSPILQMHDPSKHTDYIIAVLPKTNYSKVLAEYIEWVQTQEYGTFEYQYIQEHLDEKTSVFLGSFGHFQNRFNTQAFIKPVYYHVRRSGGKIRSRKFGSLESIVSTMACDKVCRKETCLNTNKCRFQTPSAPICKTDDDCIRWER